MDKIIEHLKKGWLGYVTVALMGAALFTDNNAALSVAECAFISYFLIEIKNEIKKKK